ncbi:hypothetical protein XELAEV_18003280mg, partial [Xenopus laevis]
MYIDVLHTVPGKIKNLAVVCVTQRTVSLSWEPPEGNSSSYVIRILQFPAFKGNLRLASLTIDSLTPGNFYTFYISAAVGESLIEGYNTSISTYTYPGEVVNLTVSNITTSSVLLNWLSPLGNSSSFLVQILQNTKFELKVAASSAEISGLQSGNLYTFLVSALVGEANIQGNSSVISAYTNPGEVVNLTVSNITTSSVLLNWLSPLGNTSSFLIQILQNTTFELKVAANSAEILGLQSGNLYTFLVCALVGEANIQGNSSEISAYTKPERVQNLATYIISTTSVSLSWQPPEGNCWSYLILILENATFIRNVTLNNTTIDGLIPGNYYTFIVTALVGDIDIKGESANTSTYTKPGEVQNLTIYSIGTTSVSLSWQPPEGKYWSYLIQILENSTFIRNVALNNATIEGLTPGGYYTFIVTALVGDSDIKGKSGNASTYTKPERVQNLATYNINTTSIYLSWQPPEGDYWFYLIQILENSTFIRNITLNNTTIDGLTPGNYYTFIVTALVGDSDINGESTNTSIYTKPERVQNLATYIISTTSVSLSWQPPEGNCWSYLILILENATFSRKVMLNNTQINGLTPVNYYTFIVTALVGDSDIDEVNSSMKKEPGEVKDLTAYNITTSSVTLKWEPPEGNTSSLLIEVFENSNLSKNATSNFTTIDGLTPGNLYIFIVSAGVGERNLRGDSVNISTHT